MLRITKANSTEGGREAKNGEGEWSEGSREGSEMLVKSVVEGGQLGDEGGIPGMEGGEVVDVGIVEDVCSEVVRDGGLGTRAEELSFSLEVGEFGMEFGLEKGEFGEGFEKEVFSKGLRSERIA